MATSAWFNYNGYMNNKLAQLQKAEPAAGWNMEKLVKTFSDVGFVGDVGAEMHFEQYGQYENVAPNAFFNATEYFRAKAAQVYGIDAKAVTDLQAADMQVAIQKAGMSAWSHYEMYGNTEKVNPSNSFDTEAYMNAKLLVMQAGDATYTMAKLNEAFKAAGYSALEHFMIYAGKGEGEVTQGLTVDGKIPTEFSVPENKKVNPGGSSDGETFKLTTDLDTIVGTSGNDLIRGDFGTPKTVNAGDSIDGGAGIDTLQLFGTYAAEDMPLNIKNVEVLQLSSPLTNAALNFTTFSKAATGIEKIVIDDARALTSQTITTTAGQQVSLSTGPSNAATDGAVTWASSATDTAATLTLAGYQGGTGVTPQALTVTGAATKTTNLNSTVAKNGVSTLTLAASSETVNINAETDLSVTTGLVATGAKLVKIAGAGKVTLNGAANDLAGTVTVDGSANTGGVIFRDEAAGSVLTFKGGSGNDSVRFAATQLTTADVLDGGAGIDTLIINDTALASFYGAINAAKNFEVLGFAAGGATVDMNLLTSINSIANQSTGALTLSNSKNTTTVTLDNSAGSGTNIINNSLGENIANVTVDAGAATGSQTVTALNLVGATTVNLVSTATGVGAANVITSLGNMDNSSIVLTGAADLTITNALAGTGTGSKFDAGAFTGKLSVIGSGQNDLIIGGSGADKLRGGAGNDGITGGDGNDLISGGAGVDTLTGGAGTDTFVYVAVADAADKTNVDKITDFAAGTDKIGLNANGTADSLLKGVTLTANTAAMAGMGEMLQNATSVASLDDVYTQLGTLLSALAGSAADGSGTVARVVEFTTGTAAGKYLVINDSTAGFVAADDIVINITGVSGTFSGADFAFANDFYA